MSVAIVDPCRAIIDASVQCKQQCANAKQICTDAPAGEIWTYLYCEDHQYNNRVKHFKTKENYETWKENEVKDQKDANDCFIKAADEQIARCNICKGDSTIILTQGEHLCNRHIRNFSRFLSARKLENEVALPEKRNKSDNESQ